MRLEGRAGWSAPYRQATDAMIQVAVFAAVAALVVDAILIAVDAAKGFEPRWFYTPALADGLRLGIWSVAKAIATGSLLLMVAARLRSWTLASLGSVFLLVAVVDDTTVHGPMGSFLADRVQLGSLGAVFPGAERELGQLIVLAVAGLAGLFLVYSIPIGAHRGLRRARTVLTALLALLFLFAGVVDLAASSLSSRLLETVEEVGENVALSASLGYAVALWVQSRGPANLSAH